MIAVCICVHFVLCTCVSKFNELWASQWQSGSVTRVQYELHVATGSEIIKNQHKILNFVSSRMEKGVNSGKDILDFAFDLWKVAFSTSEIQSLTSLFITTETYDMELIVSTVDQFFNSSSNDFLQFAQDALKSN